MHEESARDGEGWPEQGCSAAGLLRLGFRSSRAQGRRSRGENEHSSVGIRTSARARRARFADGRRVASPAMTRGRGMGARTASLESIVTEFNSFEMILIEV